MMTEVNGYKDNSGRELLRDGNGYYKNGERGTGRMGRREREGRGEQSCRHTHD